MHSRFKKLIITIGYRLFKIIRAPIKWYWKKFNIQTSGVRVMIIYEDQLILVRHWYNSLWVMPGGGIKKNETPERAAIREIKEELGITIPQLDYKLGIYSNNAEGKNDTVHCFVVEIENKPLIKKKFNIEISDIIWSNLNLTPIGTSGATKARIQEYLTQDIQTHIRPWS